MCVRQQIMWPPSSSLIGQISPGWCSVIGQIPKLGNRLGVRVRVWRVPPSFTLFSSWACLLLVSALLFCWVVWSTWGLVQFQTFWPLLDRRQIGAEIGETCLNNDSLWNSSLCPTKGIVNVIDILFSRWAGIIMLDDIKVLVKREIRI